MSEYATVVKALDLKPAAYNAPRDQLAKATSLTFGNVVNRISKDTQSFQGGGWEIVSHNLTRIGDHLLASFVIRR